MSMNHRARDVLRQALNGQLPDPKKQLDLSQNDKRIAEAVKLHRFKQALPNVTDRMIERGKVGMNDKCLCGSGKKFKRCCYHKTARAKGYN